MKIKQSVPKSAIPEVRKPTKFPAEDFSFIDDSDDDEVSDEDDKVSIEEDDDDFAAYDEAAKNTHGADLSFGAKKGWASLDEAVERQKKRDKQFQNSKLTLFILKSGESALVQILDSTYTLQFHSVSSSRQKFASAICNKTFKVNGKPMRCAACEQGGKISSRTVIHLLDYRGTWSKELGAPDKKKPREVFWEAPLTVGQTLSYLDRELSAQGKSIENFIFKITRLGEGTATTYSVERHIDKMGKVSAARPYKKLHNIAELYEPYDYDTVSVHLPNKDYNF